MVIDLFIPCYIDQIFPDTAWNTVKVLEKAGCSVNYNPEQTCCGQIAFNAGYWDDCKEIGSKFIKEFYFDRYIVCPSSSCVNMVKNRYQELFFNTALHNEFKQVQRNIQELSFFLVNTLKVQNLGATLMHKVAWMDACCANRDCGIYNEPRTLLSNVKGLELIEPDTDECCGFGGMFAIKNDTVSTELGKLKIEAALEKGAEYITSTDLSCLMHLDGIIKAGNYPLQIIHLADILARF